MADITVEAFTVDHMEQYIRLWDLLSTVHLYPDTEDSIVWTLTPNGCYSASSAYKGQFLAALPCPFLVTSFGRLGPHQNAASSHGLLSKTASGLLIASPNEDGRINRLVSIADAPLKRLGTFSSSAASL